MPKTIDITDLKAHVVLYSESHKGFHYCRKQQYKIAAELDQPGYDWELKSDFDSEAECEDYIIEQKDKSISSLEDKTVAELKELAKAKNIPEAEYKGLKKAELIDLLKS